MITPFVDTSPAQSQRSLPMVLHAARPSSRLLLAAMAALLGLAAIGCGSKSPAAASRTPPAPAATSPAPAPAASPSPAASAAAPTVDLTGTWSGTYSGVASGTFKLTWTQTGSGLNGTIDVSSAPSTLPISGTVVGSTIQFGSVGGIQYSGTVSGNSMSGTWVAGPGSTGNTWSASKG